MNNNFINYKFLNCSKEVIYCLKKAKQIAIITNYKYINTIHLSLSLIFNSKLIQKILNIKKLNKKIILNTIFNYNINITNLNKKNFLNYTLEKNILIIFNFLNNLEYSFNTLLLFYYLWKQNIKLYNFIFNILNIKNINIIFLLIKNYINNFLLNINIPNYLKDFLKLKFKNLGWYIRNILQLKEEIKWLK